MNKIKKILLSFLAGVDVTFYMFTPIILATLWINLNEVSKFSSFFFYGIGLLATLFRAIKIGWMK
jgi:hypothetical protein